MSSLRWNQFGTITGTPQLLTYLRGREYGHSYYFYYAGLGGIEGILGSRSFWINSFDSFNDKKEATRITNPKSSFALCFSTGLNENLPLWYLYSGLSGEGGRIWMKKAGIRKLLDSAKYELREKGENRKPTGPCIPLEVDKDISVTFGDVVYYGESNKTCLDLKYNTMTNHIFPLSEKHHLLNMMEGFTKGLIWYYEKETRLLIKMTPAAEKYLSPEKHYMIVMHFDESAYRKPNL